MTELDKRIRAILLQLSMLSETASASIVANDVGSRKPESMSPPGARPDRNLDGPPPKDRSLFEWYQWHFEHTESEDRKRLLCYLAERDLINAKHRKPQPRGKRGPESEREGMERIVKWYEGVDGLEVAILEGISVQHVEKARRVHKRSSKTGLPISPWRGWSEEFRIKAITERRKRGYSQEQIASEYGVSKRTIQRYWGKTNV